MARSSPSQRRGQRTGYVRQDGSDAYYKRLAQQGVQQNNPPGTAYLLGSNNLGYGVVAAYDANNNFIGFVRGNLGDGVRVDYNADGSAAGISTPSNPTPRPEPPASEPPKFSFNSQDEQYVNDLAARRRAFDTMLANITASEDTLGSNYGFGFQRYETDQYNPQGVLVARAGDVNQTTLSTPTNYDQQTGLDTANPFSRASLLNQSYVQANRVGEGSYANRGLLTSGAYGRSLNRNAQNRAQSFDTLQKDFASRLNEYRNQRQGGYSQYDTDRTNLYRDAFARQRDTFLANNPS